MATSIFSLRSRLLEWAAEQLNRAAMRHESIETTLKYYVGRNAQSTAAVLWKAHHGASNISGNSAQNQPQEHSVSVDQSRLTTYGREDTRP